jgi:hypothetical protein
MTRSTPQMLRSPDTAAPDDDAIRAAIAADAARRGQPVSKLGFFCAPFRPAEGPLADRVIKVYRGLRDEAALDRLAAAHRDYVAALHETGVPMPDTAFTLLPEGDRRVPVVVQAALAPAQLMRPRMIEDALPQALAHMEAAGVVIARFWNAADRFDTRIGFHPSIRNFGLVDGEAVFFDTFPPLIHYSRAEMGRMLITFADTPLMRVIGPVLARRVTAIQDEWYSPAETLVGIVGSACRLRQAEAEAFLDWGRDFTAREMPRWEDEILPLLQAPPKLGGLWTGMRKVLGLQGAPDVSPRG